MFNQDQEAFICDLMYFFHFLTCLILNETIE